jgi:hypothetical protein
MVKFGAEHVLRDLREQRGETLAEDFMVGLYVRRNICFSARLTVD